MGKLLYEEETYRIRGAIFEVYREKGPGFLEPVYQECLAIEFGLAGIPFQAQQPLALSYKGRPLTQTYIPDFLCFDKIIIEIKAVKALADEHRAQLFNYLKATGLRLGLLVNFCSHPEVTIERIIQGKEEAK
jgi:GxxExxY protein